MAFVFEQAGHTVDVVVLGKIIQRGYEGVILRNIDMRHPGFEKRYWCYYYNNSAIPVDATINFVYDTLLIFKLTNLLYNLTHSLLVFAIRIYPLHLLGIG